MTRQPGEPHEGQRQQAGGDKPDGCTGECRGNVGQRQPLTQVGQAGIEQTTDTLADLSELGLDAFADDVALGRDQLMGQRRFKQWQTALGE